MLKSLLLPAVLLLIPQAGSQDRSGGHRWDTYVNIRYGYNVCWPTDLLKAQREAGNEDGREFKGAHGEIMRVYGFHKMDENDTFASEVADAAKNLGGDGAKVTYTKQGKNWVAASGTGKGDSVFYTKKYFHNDVYKTFEIVYPRSEAAVYDAVTAHISGCFFSGEGAEDQE